MLVRQTEDLSYLAIEVEFHLPRLPRNRHKETPYITLWYRQSEVEALAKRTCDR